jgi:hypothetical protein
LIHKRRCSHRMSPLQGATPAWSPTQQNHVPKEQRH